MKTKKSKLDAFADQLAVWFKPVEKGGENLKLAEAQARLAGLGCSVSLGRLSVWWDQRQREEVHTGLMSFIRSGSRQAREVREAFEQNPAPELADLIKTHRLIAANLSALAVENPELIKLSDQLTRTVIEYISGQTKADHKERELKLAEEKFQFDFCEKILDRATRELAERIASSDLSQADKIAAMRREAFKDVEALKASGKLQIPKA